MRLLVTKYSCDLNAPDVDGKRPFRCAGLGGSVECVELLINEFHCDINTKVICGKIILHNACFKGHSSLVRLLVTKYSCDLMVTPLTCAGLGGSVECVELLINEFHCDINTKDSNGRSILHKAYAKGHIGLLRLLVVKYGFDLSLCAGYSCGALKDDLGVIERLKEKWNGSSVSDVISVGCLESVDISILGKSLPGLFKIVLVLK